MGIAVTISIPHRKIVDYLLNLDHPVGGSKARFFIDHGFDRERPEELAQAIHDHLVHPDTVRLDGPHPRGYGVVIEARGVIPTPSGRTPNICSVWIQRDGDGGQAVFVTAYPD